METTREGETESTTRRPRRQPLSPAAHLLDVQAREPELIEARDVEAVARLATGETQFIGFMNHLQQIWNSVLEPMSTRGRKGRRAEAEANAYEAAAGEFSKFVDSLYDQFAGMTKEAAQREVGAIAKILSGLKRGQKLGEAMNREEFRARYFKLAGTAKE